MIAILLGLSLLGCTGDDAPAAPTTNVAPKAADKLAEAKRQFAAGKPAEALATAEAWLATHPESDETWDLAELAALRSGAAAAMVDRLSASQAIGGRGERHHALRGALALAAGRAGDALASARALGAAAPGDAAALVAGAVAAGSPAPEPLDPATAALLAYLVDPSVPLDPAAEALPGWRVALVRAQARLGRGDRAGALAEAGKAENAGVVAALGAGRLRIQAAANVADAMKAADSAARVAATAGDAAGAGSLLEAVLPMAAAHFRAEDVAKLAAELRKAATDAGNAEGAGVIAVTEAFAALRAGLPLQARDAAVAAAATSGAKSRGGWALAMSGLALGDADLAAQGAAAAGDPWAAPAKDAVAVLHGEDPPLPSAGLPADEASLQALLAAGFLDAPAPVLAVAAQSPAADLRTWAWSWGDRTSFPADAGAKPSAQAESHARGLLLGTATGPFLDTSHPGAAHWNAAMNGEPGTPGTAGLAAWPRARAAVLAGDATTAAREYGTLGLAVPAWRSGPWEPILVLDGPAPEMLLEDSARVTRMADALPVAAAIHGWSHRRQSQAQAWTRGVQPFAATATAEQRAATWAAAARLRALETGWLAGAWPYPADAAAALSEAEKAAGLAVHQPPSINGIRQVLESAAVLSFRPVGREWEGLYITPTGGELFSIAAPTVGLAESWTRSVLQGDASVGSGDRLRAALLDQHHDVLLGFGRYLVVGPAPLGTLSFVGLPEQADGLRFMGEIRNVSHFPDVDVLAAEPVKPAEEYTGTLIALCAAPAEAEAIRRIFPAATVLEGRDATVAAYKDKVPGTRFVHVGDFPAAPGGGWRLADGVLSLADVAGTRTQARTGYFGGSSDPGTAILRIAAARRAGVSDLLVGHAWQDPAIHDKLVSGYWEGVNRRYSASRAFADARTTALSAAGPPTNRIPANWAGYMVGARP